MFRCVLYSISPHTMHWTKHKINKILTQKLCFKRIQENCEQKARTRWNLNCFLISCTPSHQKKSRVPKCYFISLQSDSLDKSVSSLSFYVYVIGCFLQQCRQTVRYLTLSSVLQNIGRHDFEETENWICLSRLLEVKPFPCPRNTILC